MAITVRTVRRGVTREQTFSDQEHALRYARKLRLMPENRRPEHVEMVDRDGDGSGSVDGAIEERAA